MTKYYLLPLLLLLPCLCFGQADFEGQVINKTTEMPILGVTVRSLKGKIATQTNERGYYSLSNDTPQPNDTLQYSYVGYKTLRLPVSAYQPKMFIALEPLTIQLNEVRIGNSKKETITLSSFSAYDVKNIISDIASKSTQMIARQTTVAKRFTAPKPDGLLMRVSLGRQDHPASPSYATKNSLTKFLLKVYKQNALTGAPGEVLLKKEISLTDNAMRIDIDVSKENIIIPGQNFFVAIEWLINPYNEIILMMSATKVDRVTRKGQQVYKDATNYWVDYQPFLVGYYREDNKPNSILYTSIDKKWVELTDYSTELALSATLIY
ncbi:MAG: carboxypeptidase-like regulatory domain-containing protein [Bacteroidota bacterium]